MNSIRKWIRDLFGFSGTEINGFVILIPLMLLFVLSEPLYHGWVAARESRTERDSVHLDSLTRLWIIAATERIRPVEPHFFEFDPNIATVEELRRLGMDGVSANRIAAYRSKGGVFRSKSDLLKIYGLDSTLYKQLYAYIKLPTTISPALRREKSSGTETAKRWKEAKLNSTFDINTADTLLLKSVYGIGSRLAARIVKFRDALGGFVTSRQLYEVYGLDSMVVMELQEVSFIQDGFIPKKININIVDEKTLSAHPYIGYKLARMLVSYRFQHGDFIQVSDIKKLSAIKPEEMERLLPYLKVKD